MCAPSSWPRLVPSSLPHPMAGVLLTVCCGCMCPRNEGSAGMTGQSFRNSHSRAHPFSLKAVGYPGGKPSIRKEGRPSLPLTPIPQDLCGAAPHPPPTPGLFQGKPQLKTAQHRQSRASWGLRTPILSSIEPYLALLPFLGQLHFSIHLLPTGRWQGDDTQRFGVASFVAPAEKFIETAEQITIPGPSVYTITYEKHQPSGCGEWNFC